MKILHLLEDCPRGGAERLVLDLLNNCEYAKIKNVEFYWACNKRGHLYQDFVNSGAKQISYKRKFAIDFIAISNLRKKIKEEHINIIHVHFAVDAVHAYLATIGTKTKVVFTHHGFYPHSKKDGIALSLLVKLVDFNVVVSVELKKYFANRYGLSKNLDIIYNGIDLKRFNGAIIKRLNYELGVNKEKKILGMVGNFINTGRDQITVCKALNLLKHRDDFVFVFVGRKSEETPHFFDECYNYCKENNMLDKVFFLGSRLDVPEIMKGLDLYVYSSNHDTFGITILEAMASNVPILLNDLEVFKEITKNGKCCEVFQSKNFKQLAERIENFLNDSEQYYKKRDIAYKCVNEEFSIGSILDKYILLYKKVNAF